MALRPDQIADFAELTLNKFEKAAWTDISYTLQEYPAMSRMVLSHKIAFDGGEQLQWQVNMDDNDSARNTGLFDTDTVDVTDTILTATLPWAFQDAYFAYDEREPAFQSSAERIIDLLKVRRHTAMIAFAKLMEQNFWSTPANDTDQAEKLKPRGIPYWITANATEGFNGTGPTNFTTNVAGINPTTYTQWRSYTGTYTDISKTDAIRKMRRAATYTNFMTPVEFPDLYKKGNDKVIYTVYDNVLAKLEEELEGQNDNLGNDVASKDGQTLFRGHPVRWAPYLDDSGFTDGTVTASNPIVGVDWGSMELVFKSGEYMTWNKPKQSASQHRVYHVFMDNSCQIRVKDRRRNWVLATAVA
jgi:hypothetical protein